MKPKKIPPPKYKKEHKIIYYISPGAEEQLDKALKELIKSQQNGKNKN
jgi:hypothetical protein